MKLVYLITTIGTLIGAVGGWIYWKYAGCTGGCMITSRPLNSTLYGALLGLLFGNLIATTFIKPSNKQETKTEKHDEHD